MKTYFSLPILVALYAMLTGSAVYGQAVRVQTDANGQRQMDTFPRGALITEHREGATLLSTEVSDPNEMVRLIVLFEAQPLARVRAEAGAGKAAALARGIAAITTQHQQFRADVAAFDAASKQSSVLTPATTVFRHDYRTAVNGMAITTRRWMMRQIAALPYVRGVFADGTVRALDDASNQVIGVDRAHRELGTSGQGIVVAILDSGIDYTHPALGGGLGVGFKVAGGYDFIDDDADPMDENGHGTHVAGIVAGDDGAGYLGVAPGATLMAYRVLDANGSGEDSGIIAGIEHALDPDGNPETEDGADVMNLSLGGEGHPDDPMSQAIDNATTAGIVCVIAAGNAGGAYTIGSPGVARSAITVGASDNQDRIADFSSRGPVAHTYDNKPDVLAPGVAIRSSIPGGVYEPLSGTSMATPHVAGVVALLLERHPEWKPPTVKGVLMQSAVDIGESLWVQGAGRIDIMAADALQATTVPASYTFGNLDPRVPTAQYNKALRIDNLSDTPRTFSLSTIHTLPGVQIQFSPSTVQIPAGASNSVTVIVQIDTAALPYSQQLDMPYTGYLQATDGEVTLRVPFSMMKTPQLALHYDEPPASILVLGPQGGVSSIHNPGADVTLPMLQGTYDIVSTYEGWTDGELHLGVLVKEGVAVNGQETLTLTRQDLRHTLAFEARDQHGDPLAPDYSFLRFIHASGFVKSLNGFNIGSLLVSDLSPRFKIEYMAHSLSHPSGADYVVTMADYDGITSSTTLTNDPAAFQEVHTTYAAPPGTREMFFMPVVFQTFGGATQLYSFYYEEQAEDYRLLPPFERTVYYAPNPEPAFGYRYHGHEVYNTTHEPRPVFGEGGNQIYYSPILRVSAQQTDILTYPNYNQPIRSIQEGVLEERIGGAPLAWAGRMGNDNALHFDFRKRMGLFVGTDGDIPVGPVAYELLRKNQPVQSGTFLNDFMPDIFPDTISPDEYALHIRFDSSSLDGSSSCQSLNETSNLTANCAPTVQAEARLTFNTRDTAPSGFDPNPPYLERLFLTSDGALVTALDPTHENAITAIVADVDNQVNTRPVKAASLSVRRLGESNWNDLTAVQSGDAFTATWPADLPTGYYALRVQAEDQRGNTLNYRVEPAFRNGSLAGNHAPQAATLLSPATGTEIDLDALEGPLHFAWHRATDTDEGQQLRYVFRLSGPGYEMMHTTSDTTFAVTDQLRKGSTYTWTVETTDGFVLVAPSAPSTFNTKAPRVDTEPDESGLPASFALAPNYPNPFNPTTTLGFTVPVAAEVRLEVYDMLGRRVALLAEGPYPAGSHTHTWEAVGLPSGVYYARLQTGTFSQVRQMVLLK